MQLQNGQLNSELEYHYYEHQPEPDVRRDPNYVLFLFLIIVGLFVAAIVVLFLTSGHMPFID